MTTIAEDLKGWVARSRERIQTLSMTPQLERIGPHSAPNDGYGRFSYASWG